MPRCNGVFCARRINFPIDGRAYPRFRLYAPLYNMHLHSEPVFLRATHARARARILKSHPSGSAAHIADASRGHKRILSVIARLLLGRRVPIPRRKPSCLSGLSLQVFFREGRSRKAAGKFPRNPAGCGRRIACSRSEFNGPR